MVSTRGAKSSDGGGETERGKRSDSQESSAGEEPGRRSRRLREKADRRAEQIETEGMEGDSDQENAVHPASRIPSAPAGFRSARGEGLKNTKIPQPSGVRRQDSKDEPEIVILSDSDEDEAKKKEAAVEKAEKKKDAPEEKKDAPEEEKKDEASAIETEKKEAEKTMEVAGKKEEEALSRRGSNEDEGAGKRRASRARATTPSRTASASPGRISRATAAALRNETKSPALLEVDDAFEAPPQKTPRRGRSSVNPAAPETPTRRSSRCASASRTAAVVATLEIPEAEPEQPTTGRRGRPRKNEGEETRAKSKSPARGRASRATTPARGSEVPATPTRLTRGMRKAGLSTPGEKEEEAPKFEPLPDDIVDLTKEDSSEKPTEAAEAKETVEAKKTEAQEDEDDAGSGVYDPVASEESAASDNEAVVEIQGERPTEEAKARKSLEAPKDFEIDATILEFGEESITWSSPQKAASPVTSAEAVSVEDVTEVTVKEAEVVVKDKAVEEEEAQATSVDLTGEEEEKQETVAVTPVPEDPKIEAVLPTPIRKFNEDISNRLIGNLYTPAAKKTPVSARISALSGVTAASTPIPGQGNSSFMDWESTGTPKEIIDKPTTETDPATNDADFDDEIQISYIPQKVAPKESAEGATESAKESEEAIVEAQEEDLPLDTTQFDDIEDFTQDEAYKNACEEDDDVETGSKKDPFSDIDDIYADYENNETLPIGDVAAPVEECAKEEETPSLKSPASPAVSPVKAPAASEAPVEAVSEAQEEENVVDEPVTEAPVEVEVPEESKQTAVEAPKIVEAEAVPVDEAKETPEVEEEAVSSKMEVAVAAEETEAVAEPVFEEEPVKKSSKKDRRKTIKSLESESPKPVEAALVTEEVKTSETAEMEVEEAAVTNESPEAEEPVVAEPVEPVVEEKEVPKEKAKKGRKSSSDSSLIPEDPMELTAEPVYEPSEVPVEETVTKKTPKKKRQSVKSVETPDATFAVESAEAETSAEEPAVTTEEPIVAVSEEVKEKSKKPKKGKKSIVPEEPIAEPIIPFSQPSEVPVEEAVTKKTPKKRQSSPKSMETVEAPEATSTEEVAESAEPVVSTEEPAVTIEEPVVTITTVASDVTQPVPEEVKKTKKSKKGKKSIAPEEPMEVTAEPLVSEPSEASVEEPAVTIDEPIVAATSDVTEPVSAEVKEKTKKKKGKKSILPSDVSEEPVEVSQAPETEAPVVTESSEVVDATEAPLKVEKAKKKKDKKKKSLLPSAAEDVTQQPSEAPEASSEPSQKAPEVKEIPVEDVILAEFQAKKKAKESKTVTESPVETEQISSTNFDDEEAEEMEAEVAPVAKKSKKDKKKKRLAEASEAVVEEEKAQIIETNEEVPAKVKKTKKGKRKAVEEEETVTKKVKIVEEEVGVALVEEKEVRESGGGEKKEKRKKKKGKKGTMVVAEEDVPEIQADAANGAIKFPDLTFKKMFNKPSACCTEISTALAALYTWSCKQRRADDLPDVFINNETETVWQFVAHKNRQINKEFRKYKDLMDEPIVIPGLEGDEDEEEPLSDLEMDDEKMEGMDMDGEGDEMLMDEEDEDNIDLFNMRDEDLKDLERELQEIDNDEDDEAGPSSKKAPAEKPKKFKKSIVDDKFFSLAEMDAFCDEQESKNDDEGILSTVDDSWGGPVDYRYEEFFGKLDDVVGGEAPKKVKKRKGDQMETAAKKKKSVRFAVEEDEEEPEEAEEMPEVEEETPVLLGEKEEEKPESKLKANIRKLKESIRQLEQENLEPRSWELSGEVSGQQRAENTLLDTHMQVDNAAKRAPEVTEDFTERLEALIKQRIKDQAFDDVVRKKKVDEKVDVYRNEAIEEMENMKKSLSEVYEKEYQKAAGDNQAAPAENEQHKAIQARMDSLFQLIDAMSHYDYTPPQVRPEIKIVSNMAALRVEEVGMMASTDAQLLAPEEIKKRAKGEIKADEERTSTDKLRQRRKKKTKQRSMVMAVGEEKALAGQLEKKIKKKKKVEGGKEEKGESMKSSNFFSKLQDTVNKEKKEKTTKRKKVKSEKAAQGGAKYKL